MQGGIHQGGLSFFLESDKKGNMAAFNALCRSGFLYSILYEIEGVETSLSRGWL